MAGVAPLMNNKLYLSIPFTGKNDYKVHGQSQMYKSFDTCFQMNIEIIKDDIAFEGNETFKISATTIGMWFAIDICYYYRYVVCYRITFYKQLLEPNLLGDTILHHMFSKLVE